MKTFALLPFLAALTPLLLPAATLDVTTFGADATGKTPAQAAINKAIAAAKPGDVVLFPKGRYHLRKLIWIGEKKRVTLRGESGTVIEMHCNPAGSEQESSGAFHFDGCEDVALENFTITTDNPIGCVARVVASDASAHTLDLKIDPGFPATGAEHFFQLNSCDEEGTPDAAVEVHQPIEKSTNSAGQVIYTGMPYAFVGDRVARVRVPKWCPMGGITNNHRMIVRYFRNGEGPLVLARVTRGRVENVTVESTPSTGCVIAPPSRDLLFRRFSIRMRKDDPNVCASNSDGIHFIGCAGTVTLEDCHFKGLGDDALNVHSLGAEVKRYDAATRTFTFMRRSIEQKELPMSQGWATAGDVIAVYDPKTLAKRGTVTLKTYEKGAGEIVPGGVEMRVGDFLANELNYPEVRITGCSVENTRARAFLLQTRKATIEKCRFYGLKGAALLLACDMVFWHEMGPFEDVVVRDCTFKKCARRFTGGHGLGALIVKAKHDGGPTDYPAGVHRNLRILNNTFDTIGTSAIFIEATDGIELSGNHFARWAQDPNPTPEIQQPVRFHNCAHITGGGNHK